MGQMVRLRWPGGHIRAFTMSYDDGRMEDYRLAGLMRKYGVKGTFNINTGLFYGDDRPDPAENPLHRRMRKGEFLRFAEEYKDLAEIAVHTRTHAGIATMTAPQIVDEVIEDRVVIEEMLGKIVRGMAYPYGHCNDTIVRAAEACGIAYSRTTVSSEDFSLPRDWLRLAATCHHRNPKLFELTDEFFAIEEKFNTAPKLFYLWGHSYEFDDCGNWDLIEKFLEKMGGRDDVWYATNIEIYDYVKAFEGLRWSARGDRVYNPGQIPVECIIYTGTSKPGTRYLFPAGEEVVLS